MLRALSGRFILSSALLVVPDGLRSVLYEKRV